MEENAITEDEKKKISDSVLNLIFNEKTNISGADIKKIQVGEDNAILLELKLYIDSKVADDSEYKRNDINLIINGPPPKMEMEGGGFWVEWLAHREAYSNHQNKRKSKGGKRYKKSHKKSNKKRRSRKTRNKRK